MLRSSFYLLPSPKAQEVGQAIVKCIQPVGATLRLIWALLDKVRRQVLLRANGEVARYWWPAHWTSLQLGCEHTWRITSPNGWDRKSSQGGTYKSRRHKCRYVGRATTLGRGESSDRRRRVARSAVILRQSTGWVLRCQRTPLARRGTANWAAGQTTMARPR